MKQNRICALTVVLWLIVCGFAAAESTEQAVDFLNDIQPILANHCLGCHGPHATGERLAVGQQAVCHGRWGILVSPPSCPGIVLKADSSNWSRQKTNMSVCPPEPDPLSPEQIGLLQQWIDQGAEWPRDGYVPVESELPKSDYWSFQPIQRPEPPFGTKQ